MSKPPITYSQAYGWLEIMQESLSDLPFPATLTETRERLHMIHALLTFTHKAWIELAREKEEAGGFHPKVLERPLAAWEYVALKGGRCPICASTHIFGDSVETGAAHASQEMNCSHCGASWSDQYDLVDLCIRQEV